MVGNQNQRIQIQLTIFNEVTCLVVSFLRKARSLGLQSLRLELCLKVEKYPIISKALQEFGVTYGALL